ncbi:MAG TPA: hypothetical protein VFI45_03380 [Candidatus Acidoferrum sp.]|nr:hypothetical protein [Candidatus Acidoferrum sp.]
MGVGTVAYWLGVLALTCYKTEMPKIIERWLLFKYVDGQITPQSKPFKTKAAAEEARLKLPEREQRSVAVGVIRIKK